MIKDVGVEKLHFPHLQHRADAGERVDHNADERAVSQARAETELPCIFDEFQDDFLPLFVGCHRKSISA